MKVLWFYIRPSLSFSYCVLNPFLLLFLFAVGCIFSPSYFYIWFELWFSKMLFTYEQKRERRTEKLNKVERKSFVERRNFFKYLLSFTYFMFCIYSNNDINRDVIYLFFRLMTTVWYQVILLLIKIHNPLTPFSI